MKVMRYKGFYGSINKCEEDDILWGKLILLDKDCICYEADVDDYEGLRKEFILAVDDYLSFCEETGKEPETTVVVEVG